MDPRPWRSRNRPAEPWTRADAAGAGQRGRCPRSSFDEEMHGFFSAAEPNPEPRIVFGRLECFPDNVSEFLNAESDGIAAGRDVHVVLKVTAPDLARLVSTEHGRRTGQVERRGRPGFNEQTRRRNVEDAPEQSPSRSQFENRPNGSFLKIFVQPRADDDPRKFFCYHLRYDAGRRAARPERAQGAARRTRLRFVARYVDRLLRSRAGARRRRTRASSMSAAFSGCRSTGSSATSCPA